MSSAFSLLTCPGAPVVDNPPQPKDMSQLRGSYTTWAWDTPCRTWAWNTPCRNDSRSAPHYGRYETLDFTPPCVRVAHSGKEARAAQFARQ